MTRFRFDVGCLIALCFAVLTAAPVHAQGGAAGGPEPEVDEDGFPVPSVEGFRELSESRRTQDTNAYVLGDETVFAVHEGPDGTRVASATTGDVLWGYANFPEGDPARGYFLRDPDCDGRKTEKMALDAPFSPPDCAESSADTWAVLLWFRWEGVEILEGGNRVVTIPFTIGSPTIPPGLDPGSPDCVAEAG